MEYCPAALISKLVIASAAAGIFFKIAFAAPLSGSIPIEGPLSSEARSRAKISAAGAAGRVSREYLGTITEIALEAVQGFLVYEIEFNGTDGVQRKFLIDAGNGSILASDILANVASREKKK